MSLSLPDITPAQVLSGLTFAGTEAVAGGLLSSGREQLILQIAGIILPGVLMIADFVIRHGRSKISVALIEAEAQKLYQLAEHEHWLKQSPSASVGTAEPSVA